MQVPTTAAKFDGLKKAVEGNNLPMIKQWIKLGAPVPDNATLMDFALRRATDATVQQLCELGAVNSANAQDVLFSAVALGKVAFAKQLINEHAKSMLLLSVVKKMIDSTDTNAQGTPQMQVLAHVLANHKVVATQSMVEAAVKRGCLEAVELLVGAGAKLSEWIMHDVRTPGMIGPLVRMGGDLECELSERGTAIFSYAEPALREVATALITEAVDSGANLNAISAQHGTILQRFLKQHFAKIINGREVGFPGSETDRALLARLLDKGLAYGENSAMAVCSRLKLAVIVGAKATIREEVEKHGVSAVVSGPPDYKGSLALLQVAAIADSGAAVRELYALGADIDGATQSVKMPPLALAVENNCPAAVAALLECGADTALKISVDGYKEVSLLKYASDRDYDVVAKMLRSARSIKDIERAVDVGVDGDEARQPRAGRSKSMEAL